VELNTQLYAKRHEYSSVEWRGGEGEKRGDQAGMAVDDNCQCHGDMRVASRVLRVNSFLQVPLNLHTRPSEALQRCHPGLYGQVISRPLRVCRLVFDDDKQPIKETSKVVHTRIIGMCVRARTRPHPRLHPRRAFPIAPTGALTSPVPVVLTITEVFPNPCRQSGEGSRGLEYLLRERLQPSIQPSRSSVPIQRPQPPPLLAYLGADYRCSTERRGHWTTSPTRVLDAAPRGRTTTCAFLGNIPQTPCGT
jgi:hypothetical protein